MFIISNKAKINSIHSTIKITGLDYGTRNIFICFGNSDTATVKSDLHNKRFSNNPLDVLAVTDIVNVCCRANHHKGIWFCGSEPLKRADWIKRLAKTTSLLPFNVSTKTPDVEALANLLPVVKKIELALPLPEGYEKQDVLHEFILLASPRDFLLKLDVSLATANQAADFIQKITSIRAGFQVVLTSRKHSFETLIPYYDLTSRYLPQIYMQTEKLYEVADENTFKQ